jgi:phosphoribosylglycinamide formyltransferase-1
LNDISLSNTKKKIAVFASGKGSNAENLIKHFKNNPVAEVVLVLTNNPTAQVVERAGSLNVDSFVFNKAQLSDSKVVLDKLKKEQIDWIVLAGFLIKFPSLILNEFPNKVINIHPALLPKYGGKGMYGMHIHKAVVENKENETGITIHFVNENYDEGKIISQAKTEVLPTDTPEIVASKIQQLEQKHFPNVVEQLIENELNG